MKKRYKLSKYTSGKKFRRSSVINRVNMKPRPMRGGTRL